MGFRKSQKFLGGLGLIFTLTLSVSPTSANSTVNDTDANNQYLWFKVFSEVYLYTKDYYVKPVTPKQLMVNAMKGMVEKLDPYSEYFTPEEYKEFEQDLEGEFGGVGVEISLKDGRPVIIAPIEGTPAYKAGLKAGDVIVEIDGKDTYGMSIMQVVKLMRGKPGTPLTLTIFRPETKRTFKVKIIRAIIHVTPVKWTMIEPYNIGYIKIVQFQTNTVEKLKSALEQILKRHPKGIILDLRNNPGGLLNQAVGVADLFLPPNKVVVSIKGRAEEKVYKTSHPAMVPQNVKLVILVNKGTASASEIVSGCMQDYKRAVLVGTRTFGKFCVQTPIPIENGKYGVLKLTTAYYYTPKGRNFNGKGLEPDIKVEMSNEDWKKLQNAKDKIREEKNIPFGKPVVDLKLDKQLKVAVEVIEGTYKEETKKADETPQEVSQNSSINNAK